MINRLCIYVLTVAVCSVIWEAAQMPLYTLWETGNSLDIVADVSKCTGVNIVIATVSLLFATLVGSAIKLSGRAYLVTIGLTCAFSVGYTVYSEWLNVYVKGTWAYSDLMPIVPGLEVGLSPLIQWIVLPTFGILMVHRRASVRQMLGLARR